VHSVRYFQPSEDDAGSRMGQRDPVETAINVTHVSDTEGR
jgi:hypothetical protein